MEEYDSKGVDGQDSDSLCHLGEVDQTERSEDMSGPPVEAVGTAVQNPGCQDSSMAISVYRRSAHLRQVAEIGSKRLLVGSRRRCRRKELRSNSGL